MNIVLLSAGGFFESILSAISSFCVNYGLKILGSILVLVVGLWLVKVIVKMIGKAKWFTKVEKDVQGFVRSALKIVLSVLIIVTVISILGVPMASIIAVIASCGVAIGLALQGSLSNLAGGVMLLVFKPFHVGDYIISGSLEGTVEEIGVFYTSIKTVDNRLVVLPNAALSNSNLVNVTHYEVRRVDIEFSVEGSADTEKVISVLTDMLNHTNKVLNDHEFFVRFASFGSGCANYQVRAWCKTEDYWSVYYDMLENGKRALAKNGIRVPLPQVEIHSTK